MDYEASQTPEEISAAIQTALRDGHIEFDTLQRTKTGETRHVHVWVRTVDVGDRVGLYAIFRDITIRKRAEEDLHRSLELLEHTGHMARIGGWQFEVGTQALWWTPEVFRIHDLDPAHHAPSLVEAIGYVAPHARPAVQVALDAVIQTGQPFDLEVPLITARGRLTWVRVLGTAERRGGQTVRVYGAVQDIAERKATDALRRLQSAALHAATDAIVITDRTGAIEWANPAFVELTGYSLDEAVGRNPRDLVKSGKHEPGFFAEFWATILAGRSWHGHVINRRKDGSLYTEDQTVTPIQDESGAITHFVAIKKDVTERLQLEAQFRQAQRMESVGHLASGIAHDFNNLLTVITGLATLIQERVQRDDPLYADVEEIRRAGERAATLTRQLLAFSRQQLLRPRVINLNAVVSEMESLLRRLLGENIDPAIALAPDLGSVNADPGQIEQVLANLAVNARDAMPLGGHLVIETGNVLLDQAYGEEHGAIVPPGPYVMLVVTDSGTGMDEATRARVFEPFFTTKAPGKGTGLGLATVYGIVKQSNGFIWIYSEVGQGTTVKIYLPRVSAVPAAIAPGPDVRTTSGTETVLVVEDNPALRHLVMRILESGGYTALTAATGDEALTLLEQHASVHLLLSDVVMPGISGRVLAERAAEIRPAMKLLFMSGYTSDTIVRHGVLDAQVSFIGKPFTAATLLQAVRRVLDSPSAQR